MAIPGRDLGQPLLKVLGLQDKKVRDLVIRIPCDGIVTVEASILVEQEGFGLLDVLKKYRLEELEDGTSTAKQV